MNGRNCEKLPVVLAHGLLGFSDITVGKLRVSYFHKIDRAIEARGHPLIVPRVHPTSSISRRAQSMKKMILTTLKDTGHENDRVIIFAHSMGGLDARYMISRLDMHDRVAALVTVCTPHRGSSYADWCIKNFGRKLRALQLLPSLGLDVRALRDLTSENCQRFNEKTPDVPGVRYFSVSAARPWHRVPAFLYHSHKIVTEVEGPNDGVVSVQSATWGTHIETWPTDHLHAVNRRWIVEIRNRTGDITSRYLKVLDNICSNSE